MGTVGLSFGSPTSGTGFDVSATVSAIVGNLRNVETPWKTELTSLQSQDTAISSLGTLFSKLSNDLSSLTNLTGIMAYKTGQSSDSSVLQLTAANRSAIAGTHAVTVNSLATTSSGYLDGITSLSDTLSGSITLQVGKGAAQTINVPTSNNTLEGLESAINTSGLGISASILTDSSGMSRLSLVSGTSGANGNITVSGNSIVDTATHLDYTGTSGTSSNPSTGTLAPIADAGDVLTGSIAIQVGNGATQIVTVDSSSNTLSTLADAINNTANIGVAASVVTNADGTSSLQLVSNTPDAAGTLTVNSSIVDASAPATTSLGYTSPVSGADAVLTVDGVKLTSASNTVANLIPGVTFQLLAPSAKQSDSSLEQIQVVIGNDNTDVESTINSMVNDYNALISAVNQQQGNDSSGNAEPLFGSPTLSLLQQQLLNGLNMQNPNGYLDVIATNTGTTLSGSVSISVGGGAATEIDLPKPTGNSLDDLASAINSANIGVTATVVNSTSGASLSLLSQKAGSGGALQVTSRIVATSDSLLSYSGTAGSSTATSTGALTPIANPDALLSGSISIKVGSGAAQSISLDASGNSLSGLRDAINTANIGVTASISLGLDGTSTLTLLSGTSGTAGTLTVTSSILDTSDTSEKPLNYTNSSDISGLANLGITMSTSYDGTLTFDPSTLTSALNSDFNGVLGFFQNMNSWGQRFSTMLNNAGSSSSTGILSLATKSNSSIESMLNANISREESLISAQQKSLTAELISANQIMQSIPSQLEGINQLYSAITGYNQNH